MNSCQSLAILMMLAVLLLPLLLASYFSEPNVSEPEEYDYR